MNATTNRAQKLLSMTLAFGLMLAAAAFGSAEAATLEKVKLAQFGQAKFLLYLPLYVAQEEGFFAQQGLDVDVRFAGNDDQIFAAVMSGSVDYGMGDPVFTAIAAERGAAAKTVALLITQLALAGYTNNPDVPLITKPEQLAGLRVGSFPAPSTTYTVLDGLKRQYPALAKTQIVPGGMGTQLALLEAGKTDIAVDLEPSVAQAVTRGYRIVLNLNDFVPPQAITGLMTRQDTVAQHPDQVQRMVNAMQQAMTAIYADPAVAHRTARKLFPDLGEAVIQSAVDHMRRDAMYPTSVVVPDEYWQRTLQTRLDSGDLKRPQATDVAVDNRFAVAAAAHYGKK